MSAATPSPYQVRHNSRSVNRQLRTVHPDYRRRIEEAIAALADNPRPNGSLQLAGEDGRRLRVGPYRIIYHVNDRNRLVTIGRVERRSETTYRGIGRLF